MISETAIVRMFLDSHDLYAVVSVFGNTGKDFFLEFPVTAHFLFLLCHTDVAFIYQQRVSSRFERPFFHFIRFFRCPYLCAEYFGLLILYDTGGPCGDTFATSAFPVYHQFIQVSMFYGIGRKFDFPITVCLTFQTVFLFFLPAIESSYQEDLGRIGCPFTKNPPVVGTV